MFVIGTAGHVDHGKSTLVQALTGIDPDRLREEKARGMTIDLGFAWLTLPSGHEVSIVDVPGHERFIKNMLAGVGGIDLALLVIAADEGVMPQTREHLAILDLLGVERGIVVVTKKDLVEPDFIDLVASDVEEVIASTTLASAPIVSCSATRREGLDDLLRLIQGCLAETPPKRDLGRPRLPIDRAFTVAGFGTVVTGTLVDGSFEVGQEVEILPAVVGGHLTRLKSRVRTLQTHRTRVERALPGTRTAVNLVGIDVDDLHRGQVVTTSGWLPLSEAVDVRFRALSSLNHGLRHNLNVTFHTGASETPARLRLLEQDEAAPGDEVWAQVKLSRPVAVLKGDRFVLRDANTTIGGGTVVEVQAKRHPRRRPGVIEGLERQASGSPADTLLAAIEAVQQAEPGTVFDRTALAPAEARAVLESLLSDRRAVLLGGETGVLYTADSFSVLTSRATTAVTAFLHAHPLRQGVAKEELRSRLALPPRIFGLALAEWATRGVLEDRGRVVAPAGWQPSPSPTQRAEIAAFLAALRKDPYSPPIEGRPSDEVVAYVVDSAQAVEVGGGVIFAAEAYAEMVAKVLRRLDETGKVTLAEVRDMFGTSRRYVQAFLEHLDEQKITRRVGDERVAGPGATKR